MPEPSELAEVECLAQIGQIARLATSRLDRLLPAGLSAAGFEALRRLGERTEPASPLALAHALHLSKAAISSTLEKLAARGWILIEADPRDGRRKLVSLTPAGWAAWRAAMAATRPELEALRAAFPRAEFEAALPFLRRLRTWLAHVAARDGAELAPDRP